MSRTATITPNDSLKCLVAPALAQPIERIRQLAEEWKLAGYDRAAFNSMGDRWMASAPSDPEPIVPGLVYQGALHLASSSLIGQQGTF